LFDLSDLGPQELAGFTEPQRAWLVLGEGGMVSRFEALRSTATQLVGRDEELDLLGRRWEQSKTGAIATSVTAPSGAFRDPCWSVRGKNRRT
jgi:hypothetical protein